MCPPRRRCRAVAADRREEGAENTKTNAIRINHRDTEKEEKIQKRNLTRRLRGVMRQRYKQDSRKNEALGYILVTLSGRVY